MPERNAKEILINVFTDCHGDHKVWNIHVTKDISGKYIANLTFGGGITVQRYQSATTPEDALMKLAVWISATIKGDDQ